MASVGHSAYGHEVLYDDTPISLHQADILDRLAREAAEEGKSVSSAKGVTLRELFEGRKSKSEMIGVFLATLELIRQKKVAFEQDDASGEVRLRLREDAGTTVMFESETAGHGEVDATGHAEAEHAAEQPAARREEAGSGDLGVAP
jgi:hypothetical protein